MYAEDNSKGEREERKRRGKGGEREEGGKIRKRNGERES